MQYVRIGKGSYGQVYRKCANTVVKECDKFDKTADDEHKTFELSTVTELSVLSVNGLKHTPQLHDFQITSNDKILITMDNGGQTLLNLAFQLPMYERVRLFPKYAFQLIEACLFLQENGIIHNDIKSSNAVVNKDNNLTLIDFGLCAFETIRCCDNNFISKGTMMSRDYGTYAICPPEIFTHQSWIVEKYMPWSIGITMCEYLFKTHSFVCDFVLDDKEQRLYKVYYQNDWTIKNHLGQVYMKRLPSNKLLDFSKYVSIPTDIQQLLDMMLSIDPYKRKSLKELYELPMFAEFRHKSLSNNSSSFLGMIPDVCCNVIKKPVSDYADTAFFKEERAKVLNYMFDVLFTFNKTHVFTHAAHMLDKYGVVKAIPKNKMIDVGFVCAYLAQYIDKSKLVPIKTFMNTLGWLNHTSISISHINTMMEDVMFHCSQNMYTQTFDVQIAKAGESVDMVNVLHVLRETLPPYNNSILINKYVDKIKCEKEASLRNKA
jgi:serine/threonine protein kinase